MYNLIYLPAIIFIFEGVRRSIRSILSIAWAKKEQKLFFNSISKQPTENDLKFAIFLPAHFEQSIVTKTLKHFSSIKYDQEKFKIFVITSNGELKTRQDNCKKRLNNFIKIIWENPDKIITTNQGLFPHYLLEKIRHISKRITSYATFKKDIKKLYKHHPSTQELVIKWIKQKKNPNVYLINDPDIKTTKASKLTFAMKYLNKNKTLKKIDYIGIYDFDSKPDIRTLRYINWKNKQIKQRPFIYQQIPLPLIHLKSSKYVSSIERLVVDIYSILHIRRSLGIELPMHLRTKERTWMMLKYCLGAGMFVEANQIYKQGGFPTTADDIPLGYRMSILKLKSIPIPFFNATSINVTLSSIFGQIQNIFWAITIGLFEEINKNKIPKKIFLLKEKIIIRAIITLLNQHLIVPIMYLWIAVTIYSVAISDLKLTMIYIIAIYVSYSLPLLLIYFFIKLFKKNKSFYKTKENSSIIEINPIIFGLLAPIRGFLKMILIINALICNINNFLSGQKVVRVKSYR